MSKKNYKNEVEKLRIELIQIQQRISRQSKPVIIVIAGNDRSGRHETINALSGWMDPRFLTVNAYGPSQHSDDRPFFWRFWRDLPGAGEIAIYLRDWTSVSLVQYLNAEISEAKFKKRIKHIRAFEKLHTDAGAIIIKCWLHIPENVLKKRIKETRSTPYFDIKDELALKHYDAAQKTINQALESTSTPSSQWHLIDGSDSLFRNLSVGKIIRDELNHWLNTSATAKSPQQVILHENKEVKHEERKLKSRKIKAPKININSDKQPDKGDEKKQKRQLEKLQEKIREQMLTVQKKKLPVVLAFEGWDAAGKGGAIRRLVTSLDAGFYRIKPVAKPTAEEYAHHYLWRFWKNTPSNGHLTIFDRSWYGRVLVERVEDFASQQEWTRAYEEINDFEEQLILHNTIVIKIWLNISKEEQLRRFQDREKTAYKKFKITEEDYRNREKWDQYVEAVEDMLTYTNTKNCPWTVISTDNKPEARLAVLKAVLAKLKEATK